MLPLPDAVLPDHKSVRLLSVTLPKFNGELSVEHFH